MSMYIYCYYNFTVIDCYWQEVGLKPSSTGRILYTGIANFIDEWSHCDFRFPIFWVILENLESSKPFSDFTARGPGMNNYRDGYTV